MSDLISRESLKQRINLNYNNHQYIDAQSIKDIINTEPSVEDKTVEELEKIKHEIGKEFVDLQDGSEEWRSYVNETVLSCYEIVEKHIKELKGEKK